MTHDHVRVMLDAVLAVPAPDGFTMAYRERHDTLLNHTFRDVTFSPDGLNVATFAFGTPGAYAHISVDAGGTTYTVGVFATAVGFNVQSAGHVVAFTTAEAAVSCALGEIRAELRRQQRGW
jgi:hypothetical protein